MKILYINVLLILICPTLRSMNKVKKIYSCAQMVLKKGDYKVNFLDTSRHDTLTSFEDVLTSLNTGPGFRKCTVLSTKTSQEVVNLNCGMLVSKLCAYDNTSLDITSVKTNRVLIGLHLYDEARAKIQGAQFNLFFHVLENNSSSIVSDVSCKRLTINLKDKSCFKGESFTIEGGSLLFTHNTPAFSINQVKWSKLDDLAEKTKACEINPLYWIIFHAASKDPGSLFFIIPKELLISICSMVPRILNGEKLWKNFPVEEISQFDFGCPVNTLQIHDSWSIKKCFWDDPVVIKNIIIPQIEVKVYGGRPVDILEIMVHTLKIDSWDTKVKVSGYAEKVIVEGNRTMIDLRQLKTPDTVGARMTLSTSVCDGLCIVT